MDYFFPLANYNLLLQQRLIQVKFTCFRGKKPEITQVITEQQTKQITEQTK